MDIKAINHADVERRMKMTKVDSFSFGSIVIEGKQYNRDVLIFPDGTVRPRPGGFWRFGSHTIKKEELDRLAQVGADEIVVGTGIDPIARLTPDAESWANETKLNLTVVASPEAVDRFNRLVEEGKRVSALIHIRN